MEITRRSNMQGHVPLLKGSFVLFIVLNVCCAVFADTPDRDIGNIRRTILVGIEDPPDLFAGIRSHPRLLSWYRKYIDPDDGVKVIKVR